MARNLIAEVGDGESEDAALARHEKGLPPPVKNDLVVEPDSSQAPPTEEVPPPPAPKPEKASKGGGKKRAGEEKSAVLAALEKEAEVKVIRLDAIKALEQPRKVFDEVKLQELADSIKVNGVIQMPLLQDLGDGTYRIVVGERRCRAARMAGLEEIRALVRTMPEELVVAAQVAENIQRVGLTPLEEAWGYEKLIRPKEQGGSGKTADEVAEMVGKSRGWVYGKLKILELCPEGIKSMEKGRISYSVAEAVARIAGHDRQARCVKELEDLRPYAAEEKDREPIGVRRALEVIRTRYLLDLSRAPFDRKDEFLVPEAGPCTKCPFNAANQPGDLFSSGGGKGQCTKAECYAAKAEAQWVKHADKALEKGWKVLSLEEGRKLFHGGTLDHRSSYVELDGACFDDEKRRTWRKLLGDSCPIVTIAPDAEGKPRELVDRSEALAALKSEGHKFAKRAASREEKSKRGQTKEEKAKQEFEDRVAAETRRNLLFQVSERAEKHGLGEVTLRSVALVMTGLGGWADAAERRGFKGGVDGVLKAIGKMPLKELHGLIAEMTAVDLLALEEEGAAAKAMLIELGVDQKEVGAKVREAMESAAKAEADKAAKAEEGKPAKKAGKGKGK